MNDIDSKALIEVLEHSTPDEGLTDAQKEELKGFIAAPSPDLLPQGLVAEEQSALIKEGGETTDIRTLLASLDVPGRMKLALFGNATCRTLLIRDTNRLIQQFVMKNPKLNIKEVEEFSRNPHLSEQVLRGIADSKIWMKSGQIKFNIVTNPKTPQDIALKWIRYLQSHEIKRIAKSKNLPQVVAATAKRLAADIR